MNLNIELPPAPPAAGSYQLAKRHKDLVFLSGHGPIENGNLITSKVGENLTLEEGIHAARVTGLNLLATLKAEFDDLENVVSVLKLLGMVNAAPGFDQLPAVMNAARTSSSRYSARRSAGTRGRPWAWRSFLSEWPSR